MVHLIGFTTEIYYDSRPYERQTQVFSSIHVRTFVPIHHLTQFIGYGPVIRISIPT